MTNARAAPQGNGRAWGAQRHFVLWIEACENQKAAAVVLFAKFDAPVPPLREAGKILAAGLGKPCPSCFEISVKKGASPGFCAMQAKMAGAGALRAMLRLEKHLRAKCPNVEFCSPGLVCPAMEGKGDWPERFVSAKEKDGLESLLEMPGAGGKEKGL